MSKIIVQATALAQWYALVNEAEVQCHCHLNEDIESYLVYLLMRFCNQAEWAGAVLGLDFLQAMQSPGKRGLQGLQEVGDKSLLFCGLFPNVAQKRHVSIRYFIDLGQGAYWQVGNLETPRTADLFYALCREFEQLKNVLGATRSLTLPMLSG